MLYMNTFDYGDDSRMSSLCRHLGRLLVQLHRGSLLLTTCSSLLNPHAITSRLFTLFPLGLARPGLVRNRISYLGQEPDEMKALG